MKLPQAESFRAPRILTLLALLTAIGASLLLAPSAFAQAAQASPAAADTPSSQMQDGDVFGRPLDSNPFEAVEAITRVAPNRQVGQPGNERVSDLVKQRFESLAAEKNDPETAAAATEMREAADEALQNLVRASDDAQIIAPEIGSGKAELLHSPPYIKFTVEQPGILLTLLIIVLLALGISWFFQKRQDLLYGAAGLLVLVVIIPVAAYFIETEKEEAMRTGEAGVISEEKLQEELKTAALAALEANWQAAQAEHGLWQTGSLRYPTAAFVPGPLTVEAGGQSIQASQIVPNLVEPANLPAEGFDGPLVYIGKGNPEDLAKVDLQGAAVVIEFSSGKQWIEAVQMGAEVVLVVSPEGQLMDHEEASQKFTVSPLSVPRFLVSRDDLAQIFGDDWQQRLVTGNQQVRLDQPTPGKWVRKDVEAHWLLVPGTEPLGPENAAPEEDTSRQLVHLQTYLDGNSFVPDRSPGATSTANLVALDRVLTKLAESPPRRPVLLSVVNDHGNALHGEQQMAYAAFASANAMVDEFTERQAWIGTQQYTKRLYGMEDEDGNAIDLNEDYIASVKEREDYVAGRIQSARTIILEELQKRRGMIQAEIAEAEQDLREHERGDIQLTAEEIAQAEAEIETKTAIKDRYVAQMGLFNKFGHVVAWDELTPEAIELLDRVFQDISGAAAEQRETLLAERDRMIDNLSLRLRLAALANRVSPLADAESLGTEQVMARMLQPLPHSAMFTLDLTFGGDEVGFFHLGYLIKPSQDNSFVDNASQRVSGLARHTLRVASEVADAGQTQNLLEDTIRNAKGISWRGHLGGEFAMSGAVGHQYAVPALTLTTVRDNRAQLFTPDDTTEHINRANFDRIMAFTEQYLPALIDSEDLGRTRRARGGPTTTAVEVHVRAYDEFSLRSPREPVKGAVVFAIPPTHIVASDGQSFGQVLPRLAKMTDGYGSADIKGQVWQTAAIMGFAYDDDYRDMTAAVDLGEGLKRFSPSISTGRGIEFRRQFALLIEGNKVDLVGLSNPLTLKPVTQVRLLEAEQKALPRNFSMAGISEPIVVSWKIPIANDGTGSIFLEPDMSFMLMVDGSLVINSTEEEHEGVGFLAGENDMLNNLVLTSAKDMHQLTDVRLGVLEDRGVTNETASKFNTDAGQTLDKLTSGEIDSATGIQVAAEEARGQAFQAYTRAKSTREDLVKAVVIFLALVIPFCFFVMKLLTPYTDINRQIILFFGIFAIMAIVLQLVHPAFAVAETPQVVILAFILLGLAGFVGSVLISRFNASMTQAIEEAQMSESMDANQSQLAGAAFVVGVNNMKRRRIRTTLTAVTIVLVTFTMLSVISVGQDVEPVQVRLSSSSPYTGILYTEPGAGAMDPSKVSRLRAHFEGRAQTVLRSWTQRLGEFQEYLPWQIRPVEPVEGATVPAVSAKVLLGLEQVEDGFVAPMPLLPGSRWFSSDQANEIVLPIEMAELLGITPENMLGQKVVLNGIELNLVGLIDGEAFGELGDLGNPAFPLMPLLIEASQDSGAQSDAAAGAGDGTGDLLETPGVEVARPREVAMIPIGLAERLGSTDVRTLSAKYPVGEGWYESKAEASRAAWDDANRLIGFQNLLLTVGLGESIQPSEDEARLDPGQFVLKSSSSTEIGGVLKVAIPIILAATIILNTMLGSVMERKKEISIYNSIGLNPTHVMVFFLAESLVFGLVGSVAGYLLGQVLSVLIARFDLVDLNLNYSSLSVMVVIFLTIATVLLSTVYPAMMAARAAVPSGQAKWSMPQPEGDQIAVDFPFSYDALRVKAVCAYLHEFMKQNAEASTGKFLAGVNAIGTVPQESPPPPPEEQASNTEDKQEAAEAQEQQAYVMVYDIAPAPFDLGVNQKMEVYAYYNPRVRAHMLAVHLTRMSGEKGNWVTVNQPFLEALRKRLLSWRSQKPETQEAYYHQGEEMFAEASSLPTRND